jgi:hypothetical protein
MLTLLAVPAVAWLDHLLGQAGRPELTWLHLSSVSQVVAAVSAATVGVVVASRRPRHPVGWLLLGLGLSLTMWGLSFARVPQFVVTRPREFGGCAAGMREGPERVVCLRCCGRA